MNPQEYGYLGSEKIEISASEYMLIKMALEQGLTLTQTVTYPTVTIFVNEQGEEVKRPKEEDLISGKVKRVFSKERTFDDDNIVVSYDGTKLTKDMLMAQELMMDVHLRNIEQGISKPISELENAKKLTVETE